MTCKHLLNGAPDCVFCHRDQLRGELDKVKAEFANFELTANRARGELVVMINEIRSDLTACQLERDRLKGRCMALAILLYGQPEEPEAAKVLNERMPELMRK